jgi:hypothetical protein
VARDVFIVPLSVSIPQLWAELKCLICNIAVETKGDLVAACGNIQTPQGLLRRCVGMWCVAEVPAMKSVVTTSSNSSELFENDSVIIIIRSTGSKRL